MIAHKIIDALRGKSNKYTLYEGLNVPQDINDTTANLIERAEKFDFGNLVLERAPVTGHHLLPRMTREEFSFWEQGLLPLPAGLCWFEFVVGGVPSAQLLWEQGTTWGLKRLDFINNTVTHDNIIIVADTATGIEDRVSKDSEFGIRLQIQGNKDLYQKLGPDGQSEILQEMYFAIYLVLMLNSKTTERRRVIASPKLVAAQQRKGRAAMPDHTVVCIVPKYYTEQRQTGNGTHASPRLHWRRSHLRHYEHEVPSAKYCAELEHNGRKGWWVTVIPRFLVGRADLGEVSHEYKVTL